MFDYDSVVLALMFGGILVMCVIAYRTLNGKTAKPDLSGNWVIVRTPNGLIVAMAIGMFLPLLLGLLVMPVEVAGIRAQSHTPIEVWGWSAAFAALFVAFPILLIALLLGQLPGPQELRLEKSSRTYNLRFGTYLKPQRRMGSWEDIEGVCVRKISAKGSISYGIYVSWRQGLSGGPSLGLTGQLDQAEWLAEKIAKELGLQVVSRDKIA